MEDGKEVSPCPLLLFSLFSACACGWYVQPKRVCASARARGRKCPVPGGAPGKVCMQKVKVQTGQRGGRRKAGEGGVQVCGGGGVWGVWWGGTGWGKGQRHVVQAGKEGREERGPERHRKGSVVKNTNTPNI